MSKIKNTYIDNYIKFQDKNRYIHPDFSLAFARSFRSSAFSPGFHNITKSGEGSIRKFICPSEGNILLSSDFSGIEISGLGAYSKDKNLIKQLDNGVDVHEFWAKKLYQKNKVTEEERYNSKNGMFFPWVYGSWYEPIAKNLNMDVLFIKDLEEEFWSFYPEVKSWQQEVFNFYDKNGYVKYFLGFRRHEPLSKNQSVNTQIQGSSFHVMLDGMIRVMKFLKENNIKTKLIGEIHDEILFDTDPKEAKEVIKESTKILEHPSFEWTKTIPWKIEWAWGKNWGEMTKI